MDTVTLLDELQKKAWHDPGIRNLLLDTRKTADPLPAFCRECRKLGYEIYEMDLICAGEEFHAAMKRSTNGGGENSPMLAGEDDFYELFMASLERKTEREGIGMHTINDHYTLNDGTKVPVQGFGTYKVTGQDNVQILKTAIRCGYRFFDTASLYETERALGQAVKESGLAREEFVIETKLWITERGYENAKRALEASLARLQMDYVDLYLIHWPRQTGDWDERWEEVNLETWRALEEMRAEGRIRSIGCSNFLPHHLIPLLKNCTIKPVVNQLELHPGHSQEAAVGFCLDHDIRPMAWSPLGRRCGNSDADRYLLTPLAEKYKKSPAQISLRFLTQKGIIPIPKASSEAHMRGNQDIFDFSLTDEEMWMISCMPQTTWQGEHPDFSIPAKEMNPGQ